MTACEYCGNKIDELPRPCKYCSHYFCSDHRLPESHNCEGLKKYSKHEQGRYQLTMAELASSHAKVNDRGYEVIVDVQRRHHHQKHESHKKQKEYEPYLYKYIPPEERKPITRAKSSDTSNKWVIKIKKKYLYFLIGLILLSFLIFLIYTTLSTITEYDVKNITKTKTTAVYQNVSDKISFTDYLNYIDVSNKKVTLNGTLKRSVEVRGDVKVHIFSVVDDYNNEIRLMGYYSELSSYLPDIGKTEKPYSVQGVLTRNNEKVNLNVEKILPYQREPNKQIEVYDVETYTEQVMINRTYPKYPLIRNLVYKMIGKEILCEDNTKLNECSEDKPLFCTLQGLKEDPFQCGCPLGMRKYQNKCIPEVKCSDGTFEPECSTNKPKQCVEGKLIDNPELCGCPNEYKLKDKKCVYIKCSDGTIEPDCSQKLKMQCIEAKFVYNPNKCGCSEGYVKRGDTCVKTCNDGTAYGECSSNKPQFCDDGLSIKNPDLCGCNFGYKSYKGDCVDSNKVESIEATDYLNKLRVEKGRKEIIFDERVYNLAVARAKDMSDNNYLDHTNPTTGACPDNMKSEYGLNSYESVAENAYGSPGASYYHVSPIGAINSWMTSRGHRFNLLYENHIAGVVGCYKNMCSFLGLNRDGFGAGCYTGEEGTAFWNTAEKQPGEI